MAYGLQEIFGFLFATGTSQVPISGHLVLPMLCDPTSRQGMVINTLLYDTLQLYTPAKLLSFLHPLIKAQVAYRKEKRKKKKRGRRGKKGLGGFFILSCLTTTFA